MQEYKLSGIQAAGEAIWLVVCNANQEMKMDLRK
jgi:hypothetical protein